MTTSATPLLEAESLTFAYPDGTVALRDLSLRITAGQKIAVLGANGSGKSTLFLQLAGILRPSTGLVRLGGKAVSYDRGGLDLLRRRVGLVFQDPDTQLFASSVRQDISFGPLNLGWPESTARERVSRAIADTQIEDLVDRPTHLLSYGQKKRVAIAGILAMEPDVIVADEPTAGLDPEMADRLVGLLHRLHANGTTIVVSTHDVQLALEWADVVVVLCDGRVLREGPPEIVFCEPEVLQRAHLKQPLVLDAYLRLRSAGLVSADARPPLTVSDLVERVAASRGQASAGH